MTDDVPTTGTPPEPSPARRRPPTEKHPAKNARIAAAGISATAGLAIVAVMGMTGGPDSSTVPAEATPTIVVVDPNTTRPQRVVVTELTAEPVELTADPVVLVAAEPAPEQVSAQTNGSR